MPKRLPSAATNATHPPKEIAAEAVSPTARRYRRNSVYRSGG